MSIVERLSVDGREVSDSPEWEEVEEAFASIEDGDASTLGLYSAADALAIVAAVRDLGFFVTIRQEDDVTEMQLVQLERGEDVVEVTLVGNREQHPRFSFVHRDLALAALRGFYASGKRLGGMNWMDPLDILERYPGR